jgi:uncharacterized protein DUF4430
MRRSIAAFLVASFFIVPAAPLAQATPTQVNVRIEGKAETVFEGPVLTDVHRVKDSNDSQWRRCNGITALNPSAVPGVVPTSASSDAMRIVGETFDGLWYSQWEDYFVERWGPDAQEAGSFQYWGVLVNNSFTDVGGCQYQLDAGDEVLWVYDAFHDKSRLMLYPADYPGGPLPQSGTATLNQPFEVEVDAWTSSNEVAPPPSPTRSTTPYPGAEVAPVETSAKGFQKVNVASPKTVVTDANGRASITFTEPGWHRIKATDVAGATEIAVRSNRLDVCVPEPPANDCGAPPADAAVRMPPPPLPGELEEAAEEESPAESQPPGGGSQGGATSYSLPAADARQVRLQSLRLDRSRIVRGLVKVSWQVLDAGVGVAGWTIASKTLGRKGERWVIRVSGRDRTSARFRLPAGAGYLLRLTVVDVLGRGATGPLGRVRVP